MMSSLSVLTLSLPLALFPAPQDRIPPGPAPAASGHVQPIGFIDQLLQGGTKHRKKRSQHRQKAAPQQEPVETSDAPALKTVPVPLPKPDTAASDQDRAPPSPEPPPETKADDKGLDPEPAAVPVPLPRKPEPQGPVRPDPAHNAAQKDGPTEKEQQSGETMPEAEPELEHEDPQTLKICLADLERQGAKFRTIEALDEGHGCGIESPVEVDAVLPGISLGGAVMRCETARALGQWLQNTVQPSLEHAMPGRKIVAISPGTTFACRLRNDAATGMISEHARGNAYDVASFKLDDGSVMEMKPRQDDHTMEGAFQKAVTAGACLYFTTVLAPGSDAAHETHMHVDVKERKNGYRICDAM